MRRFATRGLTQVTFLQAVKKSAVADATAEDGAFRQARRHLDGLERLLALPGVGVTGRIAVGDPAREILEEVRRESPTLVAMSTHGRSGVDRWVRGSVAERVLRECSRPLLLANPFGLDSAGEGRALARILVPLDGSKESAEVLPLVREVADRQGAEILLLHVTEPASAIDPDEASFLTRLDVEELLEEERRRLGEERTRILAVRGEPAATILDAAERERADLVAMTTHGRSGVSRWVFGSVAEKVLRECRSPLLVTRTARAAGSAVPGESVSALGTA